MHARPHIPQFDASVCVSTQFAPQSVRPVVHMIRQVPFMHDSPLPHA
jgi:hypothetical protein